MDKLSPFSKNPPLSPLADVVVSSIFCDEVHAALAAKSLAQAVVGDLEGEVTRVVPQSASASPAERGVRVDVEMRTDANELVLVEFQFGDDSTIYHRNLLAASRHIARAAKSGMTHAEVARTMPKVVSLNFLGFNVRDDDEAVVQPVRLFYENGPRSVALDRFSVYSIQLPRFLERITEPVTDLDCWLYTMAKSHEERVPVKELVDMHVSLKEFLATNEGYAQYCNNIELIDEDEEVMDAYFAWVNAKMREEGELDAARRNGFAEGRAEGRAAGRAEGRAEGRAGLINAMLSNGASVAEISRLTGLPPEEFEGMEYRLA